MGTTEDLISAGFIIVLFTIVMSGAAYMYFKM